MWPSDFPIELREYGPESEIKRAGFATSEWMVGLVICQLWKYLLYPVAMTNIAIAYPLKIVIFYSYVSLPEGKWT